MTQSFFANQQKLADIWTIGGFVQSLFGIDRSPLVYPLWFVRDLLIFVLLSPLWWLVLKTLGWWLLLPIVNLVFLVQDSQPGPNRFGPNRKGNN